MKRLFTKGIARSDVAAILSVRMYKNGRDVPLCQSEPVSCSFLGEGNQPLEITVKASPAAYEATPGATWVKATQSEDGKVLHPDRR